MPPYPDPSTSPRANPPFLILSWAPSVFAVGTLLFFATSPTATPEMADADRGAIAQEVQQVVDDGFADAAANDFEE